MKKVFTIVTVALWLGAAQTGGALSASTNAGVTAGSVKVTVHYKGKGKVDPTHKVWIWLFDSPNIGPGTMPIDQGSVDQNDTEATFNGVIPAQVWIAVAYDESGAMTGEGPPPTGSPIGILMKEGAPAPVSPGEKGVVSLTFDESIRMP